jgi:hypothetical protein
MFLISLKQVLNNLLVEVVSKHLVYRTLAPKSLSRVTILKKLYWEID